jgi:hypothetical protein
LLATLFLRAGVRATVFLAVFLAAVFFAAFVRGAARFFAALRGAAAFLDAFRAAAFRDDAFFAARVRFAAEVLLAGFAAFFRPPVAEPFRFAITRSFPNVRNQLLTLTVTGK